MAENEINRSSENERNLEEMLNVLESAFEKGVRVSLTVLEPSGSSRTNEVFVEGMEAGYLYVSDSKDSPVMGIKIDDVLKAEEFNKSAE